MRYAADESNKYALTWKSENLMEVDYTKNPLLKIHTIWIYV